MSMLRSYRLVVAALLAAGTLTGVGCTRVSQRELRYPIFAVGEAPDPFLAGDWTVTLTQARIGFGPAYFCATAAASSDLCSTAVSELADSVEVDGLDPQRRAVGEANGLTGTVRSVGFDYAFDWFTTQREARPAAAAPGGHSALFSGTAQRMAQTLHFTAAIDVVPQFQDTRAVQGEAVSVRLDDPEVELTIAFPARTWWRGVDFTALAALAGDPIAVLPDSPAYEAVVLAMTAGAPPSFEWSTPSDVVD